MLSMPCKSHKVEWLNEQAGLIERCDKFGSLPCHAIQTAPVHISKCWHRRRVLRLYGYCRTACALIHYCLHQQEICLNLWLGIHVESEHRSLAARCHGGNAHAGCRLQEALQPIIQLTAEVSYASQLRCHRNKERICWGSILKHVGWRDGCATGHDANLKLPLMQWAQAWSWCLDQESTWWLSASMLARAEGGRGTVKRCAGCRAAHLPWNRLGVRDGCGSKLRAGGRAGAGAGASRALLRPSKSSSADWDEDAEACAADACGLCAAVCMERLF